MSNESRRAGTEAPRFLFLLNAQCQMLNASPQPLVLHFLLTTLYPLGAAAASCTSL